MSVSEHEMLPGESKLPSMIDFIMADQQVIDAVDTATRMRAYYRLLTLL